MRRHCFAFPNCTLVGGFDEPGLLDLPEVSPLLFVGNARAVVACDCFDLTISLSPSQYAWRPKPPRERVFPIFPYDFEAEQDINFSLKALLNTIAMLAKAFREGKKVVIHCAWGQNRSLFVAVAYAILCKSWPSERAVQYVKWRDLQERCHQVQKPMCNQGWFTVLQKLERNWHILRNACDA